MIKIVGVEFAPRSLIVFQTYEKDVGEFRERYFARGNNDTEIQKKFGWNFVSVAYLGMIQGDPEMDVPRYVDLLPTPCFDPGCTDGRYTAVEDEDMLFGRTFAYFYQDRLENLETVLDIWS